MTTQLTAGTRLGDYEIVDLLGRGGMGEVYRAHDARIGRDVAVKLLRPELAANEDRLQRFAQEARTAGALNHPNLLTVHDIGTHEGSPYLVTELLEGDTLRERLGETVASGMTSASGSGVPATGSGGSGSFVGSGVHGPRIPTRKAVEYAVQIASGLAAAHERGIVHRDVKPENVFVTTDGRVKLLDFGLAKLRVPEGGDETDVWGEGTTPGMVLGTMGYMSPEQARGQELDERSDIFSTGVVLYEMLSGSRAFGGATAADTMTAILSRDPPALAGEGLAVSPALDRIVRRCLEKEAGERFESARDLAFALEAVGGATVAAGSGVVAAEPAGSSSRPGWGALAGAAALVVVGFAVGRMTGDAPSGIETTGLAADAVAGGDLRQLAFDIELPVQPAISPDGDSVVFVAWDEENTDLYSVRVGGENAVNLTSDSPDNELQPDFSPDGDFVAFRSHRGEGGIFVMGATGESVRRMTDFGFNPAWSPDGTQIAFSTESINSPAGRGLIAQLWVVDVATGETRLVTEGDAVQPDWSPSGERIAFWGLPENSGRRVLQTVAAAGGPHIVLVDDEFMNWNPTWSPDGGAIFFLSDRSGVMNIWRLPVDQATGEPRGDAEPVTAGTATVDRMTVAADGTIAFATERTIARISRMPFDLESLTIDESAIEVVVEGSRQTYTKAVSPDGEWLVVAVNDHNEDLMVMRADGSSRLRLTDDAYRDRGGSFSPDGEWIYFFSNRTGSYQTWKIRRDGGGLEQVTERGGSEPVVSPDGRWLVVTYTDQVNAALIDLTLPLPDREVGLLPNMADGTTLVVPSWSPDGSKLIGSRRSETVRTLPGIVVLTIETGEFEILHDRGFGAEYLPDGRILSWDSGYFVLDPENGDIEELRLPVESEANLHANGSWSEIWLTESDSELDLWLLHPRGAS